MPPPKQARSKDSTSSVKKCGVDPRISLTKVYHAHFVSPCALCAAYPLMHHTQAACKRFPVCKSMHTKMAHCTSMHRHNQ